MLLPLEKFVKRLVLYLCLRIGCDLSMYCVLFFYFVYLVSDEHSHVDCAVLSFT